MEAGAETRQTHMKRLSTHIVMVALAASVAALAQTPPTAPSGGQRGMTPPGAPQQPQPGGRGGRGGGQGGIQILTLTSTAFAPGASIPVKYTQAGGEVSPPLAWTNVPERQPGAETDPVVSFVLIVHDPSAAVGNGLDDLLHWMVWNIPGTSRGLPEGVPQGPQLQDGMRQISATGPNYRGPGAPASGPPHHYVFELYALDTTINVQPVGQSPAETRAAVVAAMAGRIRAKGVLIGVFKRAG
jgi:Raf kinase inhibitor-like YbhB/YbcL family protein